MEYHYYTCDVFTDAPFGGNQLAVFPDARGIPEELLPKITREFNYSETTFVYPPDDPAHARRVRIFTPGSELPFAGHPTVGTAVVLAVTGAIPLTGEETRIVFEEKVGAVPVTIRRVNGAPTFAQLTAAKLPEFNDTVPAAEDIAQLLTLGRHELDDARFPLRFVSVGFPFLFVAVRGADVIGRIRINVPVMEALGLKEIFVFTDECEREGFHYHARMFAPLLGIPEDPATGSAAAAFAGYLAVRDPLQNGTVRWNLEQGCEMGRPSLLYIEADKSNGAVTSVRVGGNAVMVMEGRMTMESTID
ncbi:MAG: PhzF family phenazine biosynthesis protein [Bacteroidetes bacterium]|nr:PhzF family phenazine biosynthesis protein [Bacteroidota bacterium]